MTRDEIKQAKRERRMFSFKYAFINVACKVIAISKNTASVTIELMEDDKPFSKGDRLTVNSWEIFVRES